MDSENKIYDLKQDNERLSRMVEIMGYELAAERHKSEAIFNILMRINMLLSPAVIKASDGKSYKFNNPMANEVLHELSERIRAIPEDIEKAKNKPLVPCKPDMFSIQP